jgi:hypothetical protein
VDNGRVLKQTRFTADLYLIPRWQRLYLPRCASSLEGQATTKTEPGFGQQAVADKPCDCNALIAMQLRVGATNGV